MEISTCWATVWKGREHCSRFPSFRNIQIRFGEPEPSALIVRRLLLTRVLTCASPAYLKRHGQPRLPQELETKTHECLFFRDSATGRPFPWEFHQGKNCITVAVKGRLILNDALTQLDACLAGHGVAQVFDLGIGRLLKSGKLINLFPNWSDELFPLHLYHTSRRIVPVKLRTFIDFVASSFKEQEDLHVRHSLHEPVL